MIEDVLKGGSSCLKYLGVGKVFVVLLCYRPFQKLSDDRSINLNLSDHVRFSQGKMTLAVCTNWKNRACYICDHIEYKL